MIKALYTTMSFKSLAQMRKCYAMHDPNWDCKEFSRKTPNIKDLPEYKKKQIKEFVEFLEEIDPALAKELKEKNPPLPLKKDKKVVYELKKKPVRYCMK